MKIKREVDEKPYEFTLTKEELREAFLEAEHLSDVEIVRTYLKGSKLSEELSPEEYEKALNFIAYEMRNTLEENHTDLDIILEGEEKAIHAAVKKYRNFRATASQSLEEKADDSALEPPVLSPKVDRLVHYLNELKDSAIRIQKNKDNASEEVQDFAENQLQELFARITGSEHEDYLLAVQNAETEIPEPVNEVVVDFLKKVRDDAITILNDHGNELSRIKTSEAFDQKSLMEQLTGDLAIGIIDTLKTGRKIAPNKVHMIETYGKDKPTTPCPIYVYDDEHQSLTLADYAKDLRYWSNAMGELHEHGVKDIEEDYLSPALQRAYKELWPIGCDSGSYCYLVDAFNQYGVSICNEYDEDFADECSLTSDELFESCLKDAKVIAARPEFKDAEIFVAKNGGGEGIHELSVFFYATYPAEKFQEAVDKLNELVYQSAYQFHSKEQAEKETAPLDRFIEKADEKKEMAEGKEDHTNMQSRSDHKNLGR